MKKGYLFLFILVILSSYVQGQEKVQSIIPDRPDFTDSPNIVPNGFVQIESGIYFSKEKLNSSNNALEISRIGVMGTVVRVGISELFEIRAGGEYLFETEKSDVEKIDRKGLNALMIGTKFQFLSSEKSFADAALMLEFTLPFGSSDYKPENAEPLMLLSAAHELYGPVSITYNLGTQYQSSGDNYLNFYSLNFGISINDRFGGFIEHYGLVDKQSSPKYYMGAGINYTQDSNLIVDFSFGKEITPNANYWQIGAGFSLRLPK